MKQGQPNCILLSRRLSTSASLTVTFRSHRKPIKEIMAKLLLIEDDLMLAKLICQHLKARFHVVDRVMDGENALDYLEAGQFDLVIMDWELPFMSGLDLCLRYRAAGGSAPLLFLTGKTDIEHKSAGFTAGADDYLCKPFNMQELLMRVDSLLRRPTNLKETVLKAGKLEIEPRSGRLALSGKEIRLQPRELALLEFFMRHPDTVFETQTLIERVWETDSDTSEIALRTCISNIRKKIGFRDRTSIIESVHGRGYRFNPESICTPVQASA